MLMSIVNQLNMIEKQNKVVVLYACEAGSRAWGFPSKNSDYDVRFIYVRPEEWYLSVDEKRDVLEFPIVNGLDISGWDLKKALHLLKKTNPPLIEWIHSPTTYIDVFNAKNDLTSLANLCYSVDHYLYHYLHMAKNNYREYLTNDEVPLKKYLYVLRPLLCMKWTSQNLKIAPTNFITILEYMSGLNKDVRKAIEDLIKRKASGEELDKGPRIDILNGFIEEELDYWESIKILKEPKSLSISSMLDTYFYSTVKAVWKGT